MKYQYEQHAVSHTSWNHRNTTTVLLLLLLLLLMMMMMMLTVDCLLWRNYTVTTLYHVTTTSQSMTHARRHTDTQRHAVTSRQRRKEFNGLTLLQLQLQHGHCHAHICSCANTYWVNYYVVIVAGLLKSIMSICPSVSPSVRLSALYSRITITKSSKDVSHDRTGTCDYIVVHCSAATNDDTRVCCLLNITTWL